MKTPWYMTMSEPVFDGGRLSVTIEMNPWWMRLSRIKAGLMVIWIGIKFIFKRYE